MDTQTPVIRPAVQGEIDSICQFVLAARLDMFAAVPSSLHIPKTQKEFVTFERDYLDDPRGAFLIAKAGDALIGTIGYVAYDHRFPQLDLEEDGRIVEVVKLYVDPKWRRNELATRMFRMLEQLAHQAGIRQLYLHTHPFLPGSIKYWQTQGFEIIDVESDPVWQTTHMIKAVCAE